MTRSKAKKGKRLADCEAQQKVSAVQPPNTNHTPSGNNDTKCARQGNGVIPTRKRTRLDRKKAAGSEVPDSSLGFSQLSLRGSRLRPPELQNGDLFQIDEASGPQIGWNSVRTAQDPGIDVLKQIYKPDQIHPLGSMALPIPLSVGAKPFVPYQPIRFGHPQVMHGIHTAAAVMEPDQEASENGPPTTQIEKPKKKKKNAKTTETQSSPVTLSLRPWPGDRQSAPPLKKPKPTSEYISQDNVPPRKVGLPQELLLVLDLNGTLLHRSHSQRTFVLRPNGDRFLKYLLAKHTVMIWSSARPGNVAQMCGRLFNEDQRALLKAEWGRERLGLSAQQYNAKVQVYKQLTWVWACDAISVSHPRYAEGGRWNQSNTVLIDDSTLKALAQPHNLLEIPEFTGGAAQMRLDLLRQVVGYLEELRWQEDVSSFMKQNPFRVDSGWDHQWQDDVLTQTKLIELGGVHSRSAGSSSGSLPEDGDEGPHYFSQPRTRYRIEIA